MCALKAGNAASLRRVALDILKNVIYPGQKFCWSREPVANSGQILVVLDDEEIVFHPF